jgi:hypothetical protein
VNIAAAVSAGRDVLAALECGEIMVEGADVVGTGRFRQYDAVRTGADDRRKIGEGETRGERVDANEALWSAGDPPLGEQ